MKPFSPGAKFALAVMFMTPLLSALACMALLADDKPTPAPAVQEQAAPATVEHAAAEQALDVMKKARKQKQNFCFEITEPESLQGWFCVEYRGLMKPRSHY